MQRDKLANENEELKHSIKDGESKQRASENETKEKEVRINALKAQYEANISKLKKELEHLKKANERHLNHIKEVDSERK